MKKKLYLTTDPLAMEKCPKINFLLTVVAFQRTFYLFMVEYIYNYIEKLSFIMQHALH